MVDERTPEEEEPDTRETRDPPLIEVHVASATFHDTQIPEQQKNNTNDTADNPALVRATRGLMWWTGALVAVTLVMAVVLYLQFNQLQKADQTQRISNRAFVFIERFKLRPYPPDKITTYAITAVVTNSGDTPAHRLSFRFSCLLTNTRPVEDAIDTAFRNISKRTSPMMFAPKQTTDLQACEFKPEEITAAVTGKATALVMGEVQYVDTFDSNIPRVTQIAQRLNIGPGDAHSFSYIGAHNCANENCPK